MSKTEKARIVIGMLKSSEPLANLRSTSTVHILKTKLREMMTREKVIPGNGYPCFINSIDLKIEPLTNLLKIALIVMVVGVVCMIAAPILFITSGYSFLQTGHLGDTIGGVTAPISSLVGSVLVFLALKGQIVANKITKDQIRDQQLEEQRKKEITYISDLYKYFFNSIQTYEIKYFKGHKAIRKVMSSLAHAEKKQAHDDSRLYYGTAAELYSILKLGKLFLEQVNKCRIEQQDKHYFKELVRHHYDSFILPYLAKDNEQPDCPVCDEKHNGIPFKMLALIQETVALF